MTQKIIAKRSKRSFVTKDEFVVCDLDLVFAHDPVIMVLTREFYKNFGPNAKVWDPNRVALFQDHLVPAKDFKSRNLMQIMDQFVKDQGIKHYFPYGANYGVCHIIMMEQGLALPGEIICGTDSHTVTYGSFNCFATGVGVFDVACALKSGKLWFNVPGTLNVHIDGELPPNVGAKDIILTLLRDIKMDGARGMSIEWTGSTIDSMNMDERSTLCNMSVEAGANNGIMSLNSETRDYLRRLGKTNFTEVTTDEGFVYDRVVRYRAEDIQLQVACPHRPDNVKDVKTLAQQNIPVHQVYVGGCTGGKMTDIVQFYDNLQGRPVHTGVTTMVVPATTTIYKQLLRDGLIEKFMELGVAVESPGCKACYGVHGGVTGDQENCVATINRNFVGRMGNPKSHIYLSSPYVAAQAAVHGFITE